jgi:hypothetical protein
MPRSQKQRFIKVFEHCDDESKAWEASMRLAATMRLNPLAKEIYAVGAYFTNGAWTASLFHKE